MTDIPSISSAGFEDSVKGVKSLVVEQYARPLNGLFDPYAGEDMARAKFIMKILLRHYPGYPWYVESEAAQGIATFQLRNLMGATLKCVVNLRKHPDVPEILLVRLAGDLLERMHLPRGPVTKGELIEAQKKLHTFQFDDVGKKRA